MGTAKERMESGKAWPNTLKLIVAALVISAAIGAVRLLVNGKQAAGANSSSLIESRHAGANTFAVADASADMAPAKMPRGEWNKLIAVAIEQRCPVEGMTRDQLEKAVGRPSSSTVAAGKGEVWKYEQTIEGECIRNEVAKCVEHLSEHQVASYRFSPNGHLAYPSPDELFYANCLAEPFYSRHFKALEH